MDRNSKLMVAASGVAALMLAGYGVYKTMQRKAAAAGNAAAVEESKEGSGG